MRENITHYVLIRCSKCNHNHEQLAVLDRRGEDCNLFEKYEEVRRELKAGPRFCDCGEKLHASYSASVIEQHRAPVMTAAEHNAFPKGRW